MFSAAELSIRACIACDQPDKCVRAGGAACACIAQTENPSVGMAEWWAILKAGFAPVKRSLAIALQWRRAGAIFARPGRVLASSAQFAGRPGTRGAAADVVRSCRQDRCTKNIATGQAGCYVILRKYHMNAWLICCICSNRSHSGRSKLEDTIVVSSEQRQSSGFMGGDDDELGRRMATCQASVLKLQCYLYSNGLGAQRLLGQG